MGSRSAQHPFLRCKIQRKAARGSQTPGKMKTGGHCKASPIDRYMVTKSRSYKDKRYPVWYKKIMALNTIGGGR